MSLLMPVIFANGQCLYGYTMDLIIGNNKSMNYWTISVFFMNQYLQNDTYKAFISSVVTGIQFQHIEGSLVYLASFYDANSLVLSTRNRHTALINIKLKHYRGVSLSDCGIVGHRVW